MRRRSRRADQCATWLLQRLSKTVLLNGLLFALSLVLALLPFDCHCSVLRKYYRSQELSFLVEVSQSFIYSRPKKPRKARISFGLLASLHFSKKKVDDLAVKLVKYGITLFLLRLYFFSIPFGCKFIILWALMIINSPHAYTTLSTFKPSLTFL